MRAYKDDAYQPNSTLQAAPVLQLEHVSFTFPRTKDGVCDISFTINAGEFFCLLGPSGSGKTTLLRLIADIIQPQSGSITHEIGHKENGSHHIGMVFQDLALFPHMNVTKNIGFGLSHLNRKDRRERIEHYLDLVRLSEYSKSYPHELSGGQKQRLALARALAPKPALVLLDEPFAAQDVALREKLRDDVLHIFKKAGVAAMMVTHDPEEAMFLGDRIGLMRGGELHQIGTPEELYTHPKDAFTASFFGQVNALRGTVSCNNCIHTRLGCIPAQGLEEGQEVHILFRPESLKLKQHDPDMDHKAASEEDFHVHGHITEIRTLGRSTYVHLNSCDASGHDTQGEHMHVRIPGTFKGDASAIQDIFIDLDNVFIFPVE